MVALFIMYIWLAVVCSSSLVLAWAFTTSPTTHHHPPHHDLVKLKHHIILKSSESSDSEGNAIDDENRVTLPPLFVETKRSTRAQPANSMGTISTSLSQSIDRVRRRIYPNDDNNNISNDDILKRIVQEGMKYQQQQKQASTDYNTTEDDGSSIILLSSPMERVPGCIATVHLQTALIPISDEIMQSPKQYRVIIDGTADAMLSGGLLAVLADIFSGGDGSNTDKDKDTTPATQVTADDIMNLQPDILTSSIGLQSILSRGRNDGMASMVKVVQQQIKSLLGEEGQDSLDSHVKTEDTDNAAKLIQHLNTTALIQTKPTVAMLLSGGVDSSVALHLLLRQGYNVTAFYLRIWLEDELAHLGECPWEDDLQVCQSVCEHAGDVPLRTVSLGKEYRERVIQYTIEEAKRGRTPNPDIMCNSQVKFGCFLEYIDESGMVFDYVASGHYARLEDEEVQLPTDVQQQQHQQHVGTKKRLFRAPDPVKDQSYFLCALTQQQLSKVLFPIGTYQKSEVRELANHFKLPNRKRPDSQVRSGL